MISEQCIRDAHITAYKEGDFIRIVYLKSRLRRGYDLVSPKRESRAEKSVYCRLEQSITRSKSIVRQYARCNPWDFFCTLTIDGRKHDRYDLAKFYKTFGKYINNYNSRRKDDKILKYVIVPEQHKDGAWHFHGLLYGLKDEDIQKNEFGYDIFDDYNSKFGYSNLSTIGNMDAVSLYITKYINKSMFVTEFPKGASIIRASHGLMKAIVIEDICLKEWGNVRTDLFDWADEQKGIAIATFKKDSIDIEYTLKKLGGLL